MLSSTRWHLIVFSQIVVQMSLRAKVSTASSPNEHGRTHEPNSTASLLHVLSCKIILMPSNSTALLHYCINIYVCLQSKNHITRVGRHICSKRKRRIRDGNNEKLSDYELMYCVCIDETTFPNIGNFSKSLRRHWCDTNENNENLLKLMLNNPFHVVCVRAIWEIRPYCSWSLIYKAK